ncbi:MAG: radical SAM protein [Deltaproteobacteria bacterium]|nr:radical SAM protein [Deltaproteobacteria bacterium]
MMENSESISTQEQEMPEVQAVGQKRFAGEIFAKAASKVGAPASVSFRVTDRCNYECVHCYQTHDDKNELRLDEIDRILGEIADEGALFLTFMGGEFFMRRDADAILIAARKRKFAIKLMTTGHHVDDRRADLLRDLGSIQVDLSLYSSDRHVHDQVTQVKGSWERTLAAANRLRARGIIVVLKSPLMSINASTITGVASIAQDIGAKFTFDPKVTAREDGDQGPTSLRVDEETLKGFYGSDFAGIWAFIKNRFGPSDGMPEKPLDATPCRAGSAIASINPQGLVYACTALPIACGDLRKQSFREVWRHSRRLDEIRGLTWGQIEECNRCDVRKYCKRCHAMALIEDGKMDGPSTEACRHAVVLRDLLREQGLIDKADNAMPATFAREQRNKLSIRSSALRVVG